MRKCCWVERSSDGLECGLDWIGSLDWGLGSGAGVCVSR